MAADASPLWFRYRAVRGVVVVRRLLFLLALLMLQSVAFAAVHPITGGFTGPHTGHTPYTDGFACLEANKAQYDTIYPAYKNCRTFTDDGVIWKSGTNAKTGTVLGGCVSGVIQCTATWTACPANSTLGPASSCVCNSGFENVGGACVPPSEDSLAHDCQTGATQKFTQGIRGKAAGDPPMSSCWVSGASYPSPSDQGKGCGMTLGDHVTVTNEDGTRSWAAVGKYTGTVCTPSNDPVLGEPRPSETDDCPGGFKGVVNGVSKCIPSEPDKGIGGVKTTVRENADGTKDVTKETTKCEGSVCKTTKEVTHTPVGGGTPTVTVSSTTQSLADKCKRDSTNPVCEKTGTAPKVSITGGGGSGEGEGTCGDTPENPCNVKVDETGTQETAGTTYDAAKTALDDNKATVDAQITQAHGIQAPSWTFSFQLPTGCAPYQVANFKGTQFTFDPCQYQGMIHDLLSMVWAAVTAFCIIGMVGRTIREA